MGIIKFGKVRLLTVDLHNGQAASNPVEMLKLQFKAKETSQSQTGSISLSNVIFADNNGAETVIAYRVPYNYEIVGVSKTALNDAIRSAQELYNSSIEGTFPGQYPAGSKAALLAAIQSANTVLNSDNVTQAQLDQALVQLNTALQTFRSQIIPQITGDVNGDYQVRIGDLAIVAAHYGLTSQDPTWNEVKASDINNDGKIDIEDLAAIARLILQ